jgi:hypothetical protein
MRSPKTMFTDAKLALCAAALLGSASAAQMVPQHPTTRETQSIASEITADPVMMPRSSSHPRPV